MGLSLCCRERSRSHPRIFLDQTGCKHNPVFLPPVLLSENPARLELDEASILCAAWSPSKPDWSPQSSLRFAPDAGLASASILLAARFHPLSYSLLRWWSAPEQRQRHKRRRQPRERNGIRR